MLVDGHVAGTTGMITQRFDEARVFETGSWLGRQFQGRGIGTEMRLATLQLAFDGFGGETATTAAFADNGPSLGVTRRLGYEPNGESVKVRRGAAARSLHFRMSRSHWTAHLRRDDIELHGVEPCLPVLGL